MPALAVSACRHRAGLRRAIIGSLMATRRVPLTSLDTEVKALNVQVMDHEVVLLGSRVAVALSADAAAETARRLAAAAELAASERSAEESSSASLLS
jgi:hypothetical protein